MRKPSKQKLHEAWSAYGDLRDRAARDTVNPCRVCGWSQHMAIHRIVREGPHAGQPHGHAYVPMDEPLSDCGSNER